MHRGIVVQAAGAQGEWPSGQSPCSGPSVPTSSEGGRGPRSLYGGNTRCSRDFRIQVQDHLPENEIRKSISPKKNFHTITVRRKKKKTNSVTHPLSLFPPGKTLSLCSKYRFSMVFLRMEDQFSLCFFVFFFNISNIL